MLKGKNLTATLGVAALVFLVLFLISVLTPSYCEGTEDDYTNGLKIVEERVLATSIIPIDFDKLNEVIANYTTCPTGIDCEVTDLKFINIYGMSNSTEKDRLIVITKIADKLYSDMPFLYDRTLSFHFKAADNEADMDVLHLMSNKWTRRD
jgi:hypothetical protein